MGVPTAIYYLYCYDGVDPSVPVLVLIGEKDDWTPAAKCQAVTGKAGFDVVVYPGDTHAFAIDFGKPLGRSKRLIIRATAGQIAWLPDRCYATIRTP